jgi:hypothetical protein
MTSNLNITCYHCHKADPMLGHLAQHFRTVLETIPLPLLFLCEDCCKVNRVTLTSDRFFLSELATERDIQQMDQEGRDVLLKALTDCLSSHTNRQAKRN